MNLPFILLNASNPGLWQSLVNFLSTILEGLSKFTHNHGVAVILFTLIMRSVILPLDLKSRKANRQLNNIQPELKKIKEKYKNDPEKINKKTLELYQKHNISPFGGCLPVLIQMPLFFALFAALRSIASEELGNFLIKILEDYDNGALVPALDAIKNSKEFGGKFLETIPQLFANNENIIKKLTEAVGEEHITMLTDAIKNISDSDIAKYLEQYPQYRFLWIKNIWIADSPLLSISGRSIGAFSSYFNGVYVLPVVAGFTSYYQVRYANPSGNSDQMKGFTIFMPLMSIWLCATSTATFAIYWVTSNVFQITYTFILNKIYPPAKEGA